MRVRRSTFDLGICSLITSALVAACHIIIGKSLDYASYWWMNHLTPHESDPALHLLFFLLPLPAVLLGAIAARRLEWFPFAAVACLAVHGSVRLLDEVTGLPISGIAVPSEVYWLAPSLIYGLAAGVGAVIGVVIEQRFARTARGSNFSC